MSSNTFTPEMGGRAILTGAVQVLDRVRRDLQAQKVLDHYPAEHRRRVRQDLMGLAVETEHDARRAFASWVRDQQTRARATLSRDLPGDADAAVLRELRMQRLVAEARANDQRTGPQVVNGRPVTNPSAYVLLQQAQKAYLDATDLDAYVAALDLARAAESLGAPNAGTLIAAVQEAVDERVPERKAARDALRTAETAALEFARDVNAGFARVYAAASEAARAIGDDGHAYQRTWATLSRQAKGAALQYHEASGERYQEPDTGGPKMTRLEAMGMGNSADPVHPENRMVTVFGVDGSTRTEFR